MQDPEVTQDHREFRVFRVFAAISDRKAIRAAKVPKGISGRRDLQEIQGQPDPQDRKATSDHKAPEAFRALPDPQDQPDLWDLKV